MVDRRDSYSGPIMERDPKFHKMILHYHQNQIGRRLMKHDAIQDGPLGWERTITNITEITWPLPTTITVVVQAQTSLQDFWALWIYICLRNLQYKLFFDRSSLIATSNRSRGTGRYDEEEEAKAPSSSATKVKNVTPSSTISSYSVSRPLKRQHDNNDHNDENGGRPPKKSKARGDLTSCLPSSHLFACHFNKYAPSTYCVLSDNKYRACAGPGWENITEPEITCMNEQGYNCGGEPSGDDGISPLQWQKISKLTTDKSAAERKWFEIWTILFPNSPSPDQPWHGLGAEKLPNYQLGSSRRSPRSPLSPLDRDPTSADSFETVSMPSSPTTPSLVSNSSSTFSSSSIQSIEEVTRPLDTRPELFCQNFFTSSFDYMPSIGGATDQIDSGITLGWTDFLRGKMPGNLLDSEIYGIEWHESPCSYPTLASSSFTSPRLLEGLISETAPLDARDNFCSGNMKQEATVCAKTPVADEDSIPVKGLNAVEDDGTDLFFDPGTGSPVESIYEYNAIPDTFEAIESSIKEALPADPEIVARLIPIFREKWKRENIPLSPGVISCATSDDNYSHYSTPNTSSIIASGKTGSDSQPGYKHQLDKRSNDEDGEQEDEEGPPKKQMKFRDLGNAYTGPKFACHFHKYNPRQYCVRKDRNLSTPEQIKWRICGGQGSKDLRHLMDGDLKHHRIHDCEDCFREFDTADDYRNHKLDKACDGTKPMRGPGRDGIDCLKWREIEKVRKSKKPDEEKWMDIWTILFPDTPRPKDPFTSEDDDDTQLPPSSYRTEELLTSWRIFIRDAIKSQNFQGYDAKTYQLCELQLRNALQFENQRLSRKRQPSSILTPSSSGRPAYTPFSESQSSIHNATPSRHVQSIDDAETPAPSSTHARRFPSPAGQLTSELSPGTPATHPYDIEHQRHQPGLRTPKTISPFGIPPETPSNQLYGETTTQHPSVGHWASVDTGYPRTHQFDSHISPSGNPSQRRLASATVQPVSHSGHASSDQDGPRQRNSSPETPAKEGVYVNRGASTKAFENHDDRALIRSLEQRLNEMEARMSAQQAKMEAEARMKAMVNLGPHNVPNQHEHLDRTLGSQGLYVAPHNRSSNPIRRPVSSSPQIMSNFGSPTPAFLTNDVAPSQPQLWGTDGQESASLPHNRVPSNISLPYIHLESGGISGSVVHNMPSSMTTNMTGEAYLYPSNAPSTNTVPSFVPGSQQQLVSGDGNFSTSINDPDYDRSLFIRQGCDQIFGPDLEDGDMDPNFGRENVN
ncbi:uncharacterized protein BP5553_04227 [Venustampulla echinocandica]|uniref:C2H2-type domain-containing protein n=1 Tax=Venustampulla echinocandica TaxID=2656787 RepID=A0A370TWI9_9HELO|nr:uncharacterized protein BP5553_04227 [Venustampulla echinocandica]RDL39887.1 hypothetical protein BP5553_04227 [Venustampulla echinocandica]